MDQLPATSLEHSLTGHAAWDIPYDEWFHAKVTRSLATFIAGKTQVTDHDETMERVWFRLQTKARQVAVM